MTRPEAIVPRVVQTNFCCIFVLEKDKSEPNELAQSIKKLCTRTSRVASQTCRKTGKIPLVLPREAYGLYIESTEESTESEYSSLGGYSFNISSLERCSEALQNGIG